MTDIAEYRAKLVAKRDKYRAACEFAKAAAVQWCINQLKGL